MADEYPRSARLKQAPDRELPLGDLAPSKQPMDPKYEQLPTSGNIEDRRGEAADFLNMLLAPTGFNSTEWGNMLRNPFAPISTPERQWQDMAMRAPAYTEDELSQQLGYNDLAKAAPMPNPFDVMTNPNATLYGR